MSTVSVPAPLGIAWAVGLAVLATVFPWGGGLRRLTGDRALAYEKGKRLPPPPVHQVDDTAATLARLAGPHPLTFGVLASGQKVSVGLASALFSALVLGAPGMGKTRWLLSVIEEVLALMIVGIPLDVALVDPKNESYDIAAELLGGLYVTRPDFRNWLQKHVQVFTFGRDRITPLVPYFNPDGFFSDAYLASFRTSVLVDAGGSEYTDGTRFARQMWDLVLMDLGWPPNPKAATRFFNDERFRTHVVLPKLRNPQARAWAETAGSQLKATTAAFLRRMWEEQAFPQVWAAMNTPPSALRGVLPALEPRLSLSRVGADATITATVAERLCLYRYFDLLAAIPTRSQARPQLIAAEELAATVAGSPRLVTPIAQALRLSRSFGVAVWALAQDFSNAATVELTKVFALAARFIITFQSRDEASWLASHVPDSFAPGASDAERKRVVQSVVENLPPREAFLWFKGSEALRCTSPDMPDPATRFGMSAEELRGIFESEIASRSTISMKTAEELIGAWEAEVLDRGEVAPAPDAKAAPRFESMDDLLRHLETDEDDVDG